MSRVGLSRGFLRDLVNGLKDNSDVGQYLPAVVCLEGRLDNVVGRDRYATVERTKSVIFLKSN